MTEETVALPYPPDVSFIAFAARIEGKIDVALAESKFRLTELEHDVRELKDTATRQGTRIGENSSRVAVLEATRARRVDWTSLGSLIVSVLLVIYVIVDHASA